MIFSNPLTAQASPTKRVKRNHVSDEVFQSLAELILSGDLTPGEKFLAEKDWADHFGVSRLIVRQAIHRLAELGLLYVRQGGSTLVGDPSECDHPSVGVLAMLFSPERKNEIQAFRERQIAGSLGMLALAQRKATSKDAAELKEILKAVAEKSVPIDGLNETFWLAIARMTKNAFFIRETKFWFRIIRENDVLSKRSNVPFEKKLAAFQHLAEEFEKGGDVTAAYLQMVDALLTLIDGEKP